MKSLCAAKPASSLFSLLVCVCLLGSLPSAVHAALTRSLDSITVENAYFILDADGADADAATNFHGLNPEFEITVENTSFLDPSHAGNYRVAIRLMAENDGAPVPVTLEGGVTTAYSNAQLVLLNAGANMETITLSGVAIPESPLDPKETYYIEGQLQTAPFTLPFPSPYSDVPGELLESSDSPVLEFNNTNSADLAYNIETLPLGLTWTKTHALQTDDSNDGFGVGLFVYTFRYDGFESPAQSVNTTVTVDFDLFEQSSGNEIALENDGEFSQVVALDSHTSNGTRPIPDSEVLVFNEQIVPLTQLDSVNETYYVVVTVRHVENPFNAEESGTPCDLAAEQLLHFNGELNFGSLAAMVNAFSNTPAANTTTASYVETTIQVPTDGGQLSTRSDVAFGTDSLLNVRLFPDGRMDLVSGTETAYPDGSPATVAPHCLDNPEVDFNSVTLSAAGATANGFSINLPQGLTFFKDTNANQFLGETTLPDNQSVSLDEHLCWTAALTLSDAFTANSAIADESHPLIFRTTDAQLNTSGNLEFTVTAAKYAHKDAYDILDTLKNLGQLDHPSMADRSSNDRYLLTAAAKSPSVFITRAKDGTARLTGDLELTQDSFSTHFPKKSDINFTDPAVLNYKAGIIDSAEGAALTSVSPVKVPYYKDCVDDDCYSEQETVSCAVVDTTLYFTPGGGLHGFGAVNGINNGSGHRLEWGKRDAVNYAHRTDTFAEGNFYMPGYQLYARDNALLLAPAYQSEAADGAPAALLLSAFNRDPLGNSDLHLISESEYSNGNGDLAGLTFEVLKSNFNGASRLAGNTSDYAYELLADQDGSLDGNDGAKYYIREGGVNGRQVAADGSFDAQLKLHGFEVEVARFQLSFLDSNNEADGCASWVDGAIAVGGAPPSNYSDWTQTFFSLRFDCLGEPGDMIPDLSQADNKALTYWNSNFDLKAMGFDTFEKNPGACPKLFGANLAVGAALRASHVPQVLVGSLAFEPNGNLTTLADVIAGSGSVDSQLRLPASITLTGPNKDYNLVTTTKLRFNNPAESGAPDHGNGIVTFAGTIDIPYFKDLEVQAITTSTANDDPAADSASFALTPGWIDGGETFFTDAQFDPDHRCFPPSGIDFNEYRSPNIDTDETYLIKARQDMFGFIPLEYPLLWDLNTRRFASSTPRKQDIFVAQMEHKIDWMDAKFTNISFGATYDGLPEIKLTNFLNDQIDAAADAIANELGAAPKQAIDAGLSELDKMLEDSLNQMIDPVVDAAAGTADSPGPIRELYRYLELIADNNPEYSYLEFRTKVEEALNNPDELIILGIPELQAIQDQLCLIADTGGDAGSFLTQIETALEDIIKGIDAITAGIDEAQDYSIDVSAPSLAAVDLPGILSKQDGERQIVPAIIKTLLVELVDPSVRDVIEPLLLDLTSELNTELNALLVDVDPTLEQINEALITVRGFLADAHTQVTSAGEIVDQFTSMIETAKNGGQLNDMISIATTRAWSYFLQVEQSLGITDANAQNALFSSYADSFFGDFSEDAFVELVKVEIKDAILGSDIVTQTQYLLRQTLYDISDKVTSSLQSVLAQMSVVMKEAISQAIGPLEDQINSLLGEVSDYMGSGEIAGFAEFNGDSLRKLRLDAKMQFKVPEDMALHVFLEILAYSSEDNFVQSGCIKPGEKVVEVRVGAQDVSVEWISECKINLGVKLSLKDRDGEGGLPPLPIGVGGSFELADGEIDFETFKILEFGATMAIGIEECYLGAKARAIFSSYEVAAGIFFGRTCTLEPILFVDPDIGDVVKGGDSFTGAYVYGEVWLPVSELVLGVPASCLFRIDAGVGAGAFFFVQGDLTDIDASDIVVGGKVFLGVSGEALCVVSIKGEIKIILASQGGVLRGAGNGKFSARVGWCPICLKFSKSVKLLFDDGDWSMK
ncbi:hypothetical protein [Coraliomargarita akajimensis]|uniref:Putative CheA signal transduction histidine kinase n=1 Tax=Coraliomargarita akajimensis (strain DSM 45221 / IAM 15411 / JCM 23193 / KCTC 12865 / 04OKA010-24) TaxID=583355 RepID=D5ELZ9_CORAD|nr:hypothetical protein [Coraliomargarita akajimensis]ADE55159.1 putative CheA signal transduction histidine kinase [Coraliomargarita akajimensis DSM 45221]